MSTTAQPPARTQMSSEIAEQPAASRRTFDELLPQRERLRALFEGRRRVLLVARGSSDNAAVYGRYLLECRRSAGALAAPSVATHYRARLDLDDTLVVSVSQSGRPRRSSRPRSGPLVRGATVAVSNVADSPLRRRRPRPDHAGRSRARRAGHEDLPRPDAGAGRAARRPGARGLRPRADLDRVPDAVADCSARASSAPRPRSRAWQRVIVSGRGLLMGTALETALKLEETCLPGPRLLLRRPAPRADLGGRQRHARGPRSRRGRSAAEPMAELAGDLAHAARGCSGSGARRRSPSAATCTSPGPDLPEMVAPLASIVPVQLVIERLASGSAWTRTTRAAWQGHADLRRSLIPTWHHRPTPTHNREEPP